jgi:5-methylcytosine-specific restriction endonuclease McrA
MIERRNYINLDSFPAKRNEEGLLICLNCEKKLPPRRRKYCCEECSSEWMCKHYHGHMRIRLIHKRGPKCEKCGKSMTKLDMHGIHITQYDDIVMDHIIPIALGGEEFDEKNLQLLCGACNKIKTAQDAGNIAKQRGIEKKQKYNRTL